MSMVSVLVDCCCGKPCGSTMYTTPIYTSADVTSHDGRCLRTSHSLMADRTMFLSLIPEKDVTGDNVTQAAAAAAVATAQQQQ